MSTIVTPAYRLKHARQLWPVVRTIQRDGEREATRILRVLYDKLMRDLLPNVPEIVERQRTLGPERARLEHVHDFVREQYLDQLRSPHRNPFHFDSHVLVHEHRGTHYLRPISDWLFADVFNFMDTMSELDRFDYWNNTDPPMHVTDAEWARRRRVWDGITRTQLGFRSVLQITIVDSDRWHSVDPYIEMLREIPLPKEAFPSTFGELIGDPEAFAAEVELTAKLDAKQG